MTGLQLRLDNVYGGPSVPEHKQPEVQPRWKYDEETQGLRVIAAPLPRPLVTLLFINRQRMKFYRKDRHPNRDGEHAWGNRYSLQVDCWANTPVISEGVADSVERALVAMAQPLWEAHRIGIEFEGFGNGIFEEVNYEINTQIYRQMGRGYVAASAMVQADDY